MKYKFRCIYRFQITLINHDNFEILLFLRLSCFTKHFQSIYAHLQHQCIPYHWRHFLSHLILSKVNHLHFHLSRLRKSTFWIYVKCYHCRWTLSHSSHLSKHWNSWPFYSYSIYLLFPQVIMNCTVLNWYLLNEWKIGRSIFNGI